MIWDAERQHPLAPQGHLVGQVGDLRGWKTLTVRTELRLLNLTEGISRSGSPNRLVSGLVGLRKTTPKL